jgi:hypothetical protein
MSIIITLLIGLAVGYIIGSKRNPREQRGKGSPPRELSDINDPRKQKDNFPT